MCVGSATFSIFRSPVVLFTISFLRCRHHEDCLLFSGSAAGQRHAINYHSIYDNKILRKFRGHSSRVQSLAQCPADDTFLSTASDQTVRLWTLQSAGCLAECQIPADVNPASNPLAVFDSTGLVFGITVQKKDLSGHYLHLYDARNYNAGAFAELQVSAESLKTKIQEAGITGMRGVSLSQQPWTSMRFNASGNQILVTGGEGLCVLLDGFEGTVQKVLVNPSTPHRKPAVACFSSDDQYVLSGKEDGNVDCWSVATGSVYKTLKGHSGPISCIAANPTYTQFATSYKETALWIWD